MTTSALALLAEESASAGAALPLLKWAGGKRWLAPICAPSIRAYLHGTGGRYIEPCLGGAAMALAVAPRRALLGDIEVPLVDCYRAVASDPGAVVAALGRLVRRGTSRAAFEAVRARAPRTPAARAARLLYLNRLAFNGLYRCNQSGQFNVPYGRYPRPSFPSSEHIHQVASALATTLLHAGDFATLVAAAGPGDVVFGDPPYAGLPGSFRGYSAGGFTDADQLRLADLLRAAARRGAAIVATNADTPLIREAYAWAECIPTAEPRAVAARAAGRGRAACLLLTTHASLVRPPAISRKESRP